jgi:hypothetical protein
LTERQISSEALDTEVAATALIGGAAADADQPFAKDCGIYEYLVPKPLRDPRLILLGPARRSKLGGLEFCD